MENLIRFKTGRTYDSEQVLVINVEHESVDDFGLTDLIATFVDDSRHIKGRVKTVVFSDGIGQAVLDAYDAGHYENISHLPV